MHMNYLPNKKKLLPARLFLKFGLVSKNFLCLSLKMVILLTNLLKQNFGIDIR